ncbi:MAG: PIN domain-containing protein, partial [Candidatus Solibacter sp.]
MVSSLLLDTHIVVRWLSDPKRLSREQRRALENAELYGGSLGLSAMSLLKIANTNPGKGGLREIESLLEELDSNPIFRILPITTEIAREVAALRDAL